MHTVHMQGCTVQLIHSSMKTAVVLAKQCL